MATEQTQPIVKIEDAIFIIKFGNKQRDHLAKPGGLVIRRKEDVSAADRKLLAKDPEIAIYDWNMMVSVARVQQEAVALYLNCVDPKKVEKMKLEALSKALREGMEDYIGTLTEDDLKPTPVAVSTGKAAAKTVDPAKAAAAEAAKAEKEARQAAAKAEREAKAKAKEEEHAKEKAAKEEAAKKAAEERAQKEAALAAFTAEIDGQLVSANEALTAAQAKVAELKAKRAEAVKAKAEELGLNVKVASGSVTQVPKSSAVELTEEFTAFGHTFPVGHKLKVKDIHLAAYRQNPSVDKDEVVAVIKSMFPNGSTTKKDVAWHFNMLKTGKMDPDNGSRLDV